MTSFITEQRAVAPLVGAMFLFGFLVIGMSAYQAQIVPQENMETEFQHNQEVQNDLIELRDIIHLNGVSGISHSRSVTLGTNYNQRIIAINPPSPTGTISTVDPGNNISILPDSDTDTTEYNLTTKFITYEPQYREYQNAPLSTIEHTLLYNTFSETDTQLTVSGQRIFNPDDDKLIIPVLEGDILETQRNAVSLRVTALEQEEQSISDNVTVTLPTNAPELWIDEIETQPNIRLVAQTETSVTLEANVSTLTLYRLEISEVPQNDPTNSLADRFGELIPDGPIFCTVCDGTDNVGTEHNNVNDENFADKTLVIPEGTNFVPPEDPDGDDQSEPVNYLFASYDIGGNVTTSEEITMVATDGEIKFASSGSAISGRQLDLVANGENGGINVDGSTIETTAEGGQPGQGGAAPTIGINLESSGDISAVGTQMETPGDVKINSTGGSIDLTDAKITVTGQAGNTNVELKAKKDIILNNTLIKINNGGASADGRTIYVQDAVFEDGADPLEIINGNRIGDPADGSVDD